MASWLVYSSSDRAVPACVAAFSFPFLFRRRDRTRTQANGRAKERAWGEQKIGGQWGRGRESENGVGLGRSPYPLPLLLRFCTFSQFRSLRALYFRKLAKLAKQARADRVRVVVGNTVLCSLTRHITLYSHSASLHSSV